MGNHLIPEARPDKNGKIVIRHVKQDSGVSGSGSRGIPVPSLCPVSPLQSIPLKEMDSGALTLALLGDIRRLEKEGAVDYDTVLSALDAATFLHLDQTRANRKKLPRTPYIEHPLRNTIRAVRWGCRDQNILVATLLHDTVEDCADKIISHYLGRDDVDSLTEQEKRELSLGWVETNFGSEVLHLVKAVSNEVDNGTPKTEREKHTNYANHVKSVIKDDAEVFLVKFADFVDNAVGLHHNNIEGNKASVSRRARKYLPVVTIFEEEFESNDALRGIVDENGYEVIWGQIQEAKVKLEPLVKQDA
jgi:(p)ppGpp synthase/HD superfamily hydrolase